MTEQEQELLKNILLWEHEKAPELAMLLVKGIDLEDKYWNGSFRLAKQFLPQAIEDCTNKTKTTPIPSNTFLTVSWSGMVYHLGGSLKDLALFHILYSLYPDSYQEVETLEVFKPQGGRVRIQKLLKGCSISDEGKPQLSNWYDEFSTSNSISFFLHLIGECPEDLHVDESLRISNITKLYLDHNYLSELPTTIGNLTSLTYLNLWKNQLSALPSTIGNLTSLTRLNLDNNQLSALPTTIGNLTSLNELYLRDNQLSALPSTIGNLTSLTKLYLRSKQLNELPTAIGNLTSLNFLSLNHNQLSALPSTIGNLTSLTYLNLWDNQLSSEQKQQIEAQFPFAEV